MGGILVCRPCVCFAVWGKGIGIPTSTGVDAVQVVAMGAGEAGVAAAVRGLGGRPIAGGARVVAGGVISGG